MMGGARSLCSRPSSSNVSSSSSASPASSPAVVAARAHLRPGHPALRGGQDGGQRLDKLRLVHLVERGLRVKALLCARAQPADDAGAPQRRRRDAQPRARAQLRVVEQRAGETFHARPPGREVRGRGARRDRGPVREGPHAHAREQPVRRGPERRAPRVPLQRAIPPRAGRRARQRRAGELDGVGSQPRPQEGARAPPDRRRRQQRRAQEKAGQGPIHARRVTERFIAAKPRSISEPRPAKAGRGRRPKAAG